MSIISWMLTRMIATRFAAVLLGVSIFVLSLEAVSYVSEILALRPGSFLIIPEYMLMRAPTTLSTFLPISLLIAMLLALTALSYRNEIPALWAAGISPWRLVLMLTPLAIVIGGINFLLSNSAIPASVPVLREWAIADYGKEKLKVGEKDPIWMRSGTDIMRAESANADSTELNKIIIFRREPDGLLSEQIYADHASLNNGRWTLSNVTVFYRANQTPSRMDTLIYSGELKPASAGARSGEPEEMSLNDLGYFVANHGFGIRPIWVYQTWWHKRLSLFFSGFLMIALSIPLAANFRRGGGLGVLFGAGIGLGFLFFISDGIAVTMGELGFVAPALAAWFPVAAFGLIAIFLNLRTESV